MSRFRGQIGLVGLLILAALIVGGVFLTGEILKKPVARGIVEALGYDIELDIRSVDEGRRINSLLLLEKDEGRFSEVLGMMGIGEAQGSGIRRSLDALDISLLIEDSQGAALAEFGEVREELGIFVDFPLPGMVKGRMGVDVE